MQPVDINPSDEWTNMSMARISPQILIKSAYRSVMFYIGQKELESEFKMNRVVAQFQKKFEMMQEKYSENMEQLHTANQKLAKRCQMMEKENDKLTKEKQELQEKFAEKSRQKRKLDEMYDRLSELESVKRMAIQPANKFYSRVETDLFTNNANMIDNVDHFRRGSSVPVRQNNSSNSGPFDVSGGSPFKPPGIPMDAGNRRAGARPVFDVRIGAGTGATRPSMSLRNKILSPIRKSQPTPTDHRVHVVGCKSFYPSIAWTRSGDG